MYKMSRCTVSTERDKIKFNRHGNQASTRVVRMLASHQSICFHVHALLILNRQF